MARKRSVREELEGALEVDELGLWTPSTSSGPMVLVGTGAALLLVLVYAFVGATPAYALMALASAVMGVWGAGRYRKTRERLRRERSRRVRERLKRVEERGL